MTAIGWARLFHLRRHRTAWLWGVIALGAVIRLRTFAHGRSLWLDEAFLALSLIERSPLELLRLLDYARVVRAGYLLLLKTVAAPFDYSEGSLQLVSLLAGLLSPGAPPGPQPPPSGVGTPASAREAHPTRPVAAARASGIDRRAA